jgi:hypothetical protein
VLIINILFYIISDHYNMLISLISPGLWKIYSKLMTQFNQKFRFSIFQNMSNDKHVFKNIRSNSPLTPDLKQ